MHQYIQTIGLTHISALKVLKSYPQLRDLIQSLPQKYADILLADLEAGGLAPAKVLAQRFGLKEQTVLNYRLKARELFREAFEKSDLLLGD